MFSQNKNFNAPSKEIEKRINKMIKRLTLEEKIDLLGGDPKNGATLPSPRTGIPALRMADGPVGVHWWCDKSTAYPATIALAASWDRELAYRFGAALGRDCRARGVHILLAPAVNIYRSPRCGRNFEYLGEDPCLAADIVVEVIRGVQDQGVAATIKHFAANNQEYDRHGISSDADERTLREIYLPAFEAAVKRGGVGAIMTAYNLINGQHCSEHDWLLNQLLKKEWGFQGLVMSDWVSVYSEVGAANGGLDLEMPTARFLNREKLLPAIENGLVTEAVIDDKVRRLLRLAACFGWLDHEQKDATILWDDPDSRKAALDVARGGMVLLKNEDHLLPLDKAKIKKLAVIGYHAGKPIISGGGSAYTTPNRVVTLLDGLKQVAGEGVQISHVVGVNPVREQAAFAESIFHSPAGEEGLQGEYFSNRELAGQPVMVRLDKKINFPWFNSTPDEKVNAKSFAVRWTGVVRPTVSGKYVFYLRATDGFYRLWVDNRLVIDSGPKATGGTQTAVLELAGGRAYAIRAEYVKDRDWNSFALGWESIEKVKADYDQALALAKEAETVIVCVGFTPESESEGSDRTFGLPIGQDDLICDLATSHPNVIVAVYTGGNVDMRRWIDKVKGLLYIWYPGQEGGAAAAEILFGAVNPSGKLPATFEKRPEDRSSFSCYHDADGDKRVQYSDGIFGGYRHFDRHQVQPLFPFGFGLSYTTFAYENIRLSAETLAKGGALTVSFDLVNTGAKEGAEVAQLYICDEESSLPRPVKELKAFEKVFLPPGGRQTVAIKIDESHLRYFNSDLGRWVVEKGDFDILVGASSADIRLRGKFKYIG